MTQNGPAGILETAFTTVGVVLCWALAMTPPEKMGEVIKIVVSLVAGFGTLVGTITVCVDSWRKIMRRRRERKEKAVRPPEKNENGGKEFDD